MKLGDAVYAVIQHLQVNPPSITEITDANLERLQASLNGSIDRQPPGGVTNNGVYTNNSNQYAPPASASEVQRPNDSMQLRNGHSRRSAMVPMQNDSIKPKKDFEVEDDEVNGLIPPLPSSFPEFDDMPLSELKRIVDIKSFLDLFVEGTSGLSTLRELKESIEASNVDAAKANLAHEASTEGLSSEVETLTQELKLKLERYRTLDDQRLALTQPPKVQDAIAELTKVKRDAYRKSEEFAERWLEGSGEDVSEFVKKFIDLRQLYHVRAAKAERLEIEPPCYPHDATSRFG